MALFRFLAPQCFLPLVHLPCHRNSGRLGWARPRGFWGTYAALLSSFNEDQLPVSYAIRGYPIYCATPANHRVRRRNIVGPLFCIRLSTSSGLFAFLPSRSILQGQIWQILTYSFINSPSFFILFSLFFLYIAAVEVEKYIGRARFLTLVRDPDSHSGSAGFAVGTSLPRIISHCWRLFGFGRFLYRILYFIPRPAMAGLFCPCDGSG